MFILNVTPDSFSDGGAYPTVASAVDAARRALDEGADILDVGGESTRPGAARVDAETQIARVVPVIEAIRRERGSLGATPISVDTTLEGVARAAIAAGACAINDVSAGLESGDATIRLASATGCGLVLMHRRVRPEQDVYSHEYRSAAILGDVVEEVRGFLRERAALAIGLGVDPACVAIDPGLGFGKTVAQNFELIRRSSRLAELGHPLVSGVSRKSFVGAAIARHADEIPPPARRVVGSVAASVLHLASGARIFRVHDVAAHREGLATAWAGLGAGEAAAAASPTPTAPVEDGPSETAS